MKPQIIPSLLVGLAGSAFAGAPLLTTPAPEADAFANAITPISNPTFQGNALPQTNVHAIYMYHQLPNTISAAGTQVDLGGDVNVFAVQLEYAFNERISLIATKDGYVDMNPDQTLSDSDGFANLAAGLKYAFIYDPVSQFVLSGSAVLEVPTGNREVYQGYGDGAVNLIASALKLHNGWQFSGSVGTRLPFDGSEESTTGFLSSHISYHVTEKFIPLVELNWFRVLSDGEGQGASLGQVLEFDGLDLMNFGSVNGRENKDTVTLAAGARYKLTDRVNVGAAYEIPLTAEEDGLTASRLTVDLVWTF
ncbi:transporter [Rubritalea sp.]|uniref:transporter n=1 Tax=Rubritalea sp. TaxID=2109375 RepID=UPI003EF5DE9B